MMLETRLEGLTAHMGYLFLGMLVETSSELELQFRKYNGRAVVKAIMCMI